MTELPTHWKLVTLDELAAPEPRSMTDGPFGSNLKTAHYTDDGPRVIRLQNIGDGRFIDEPAHISQEHFETLRAHEARPGDLLVAALGTDLPRSCVVPDHVGPAIVKADCIRVRLNDEVDVRYVNYALQRPELRRAVADHIHGVGRPRIGMAGVRALSVPLAPHAEQKLIVAALDEHLSRLDSAQRSHSSARQRLDALRSRTLDQIPDGPFEILGDLAVESGYGTSTKCSHDGPGPPVLRIPNVVDEAIDLGDLKFAVDPAGVSEKGFLRTGDVLFVRTNGSRSLIGRTAAVGSLDDVAFASYLVRYRFDRRVDPRYVSAVMSAPRFRRVLERLAASTAGQYNLSLTKLDPIEIPVPTREVQEEFLSRRAARLDRLARLDATVADVATKGLSLRRAILAAAFAGQLADRDPADEPACELLDRIRAEHPAKRQKKVTS